MRKSSFPVDVSITLFDYTFPLDVKGICDKFYEPALILSGAPKYESGQRQPTGVGPGVGPGKKSAGGPRALSSRLSLRSQ